MYRHANGAERGNIAGRIAASCHAALDEDIPHKKVPAQHTCHPPCPTSLPNAAVFCGFRSPSMKTEQRGTINVLSFPPPRGPPPMPTWQRLTYRDREKLRALFDLYDVKKQGYLTIRDLARAAYTSLDVISTSDIVAFVEEVRTTLFTGFLVLKDVCVCMCRLCACGRRGDCAHVATVSTCRLCA